MHEGAGGGVRPSPNRIAGGPELTGPSSQLSTSAARVVGTTLGRFGPVGAQVAAKLVGDRPVKGTGGRPVEVVRRGFRLRLDLGDTLQRHIYLTGTYDEPSLWLLERSLRPGDVVLDVGANVGWFALRLGRRLRAIGGGTVHAFEPAPDTLRRLREHLEANGLDDVVHAHGVALADQDGTMTLRVNDDFGGPEVGTRTLFGTGTEVARVPVHRGADYLASVGVVAVDVVKIDVEGSELLALEGLAPLFAGATPPRMVVVELLDRHLQRAGSSVGAVVGFLDSLGYSGTKISADAFGLRRRFRRRPKPLAHNVVFVRAEP